MEELPNYDRPHNLDGDECWCNPTIEVYTEGRIIIHHDPVEAVEEAVRVLEESKPFESGRE